MLRANTEVWVTALGEETVKNCHLYDPDLSGGVWQFRSQALELSTTEVLSCPAAGWAKNMNPHP